jgi:multiple sugar transport system permease protein
MRQYFLQMPHELGEAPGWTRVAVPGVLSHLCADGAGPMATLAVLTFSAYWNEFFVR